jgi:hypothetical protein
VLGTAGAPQLWQLFDFKFKVYAHIATRFLLLLHEAKQCDHPAQPHHGRGSECTPSTASSTPTHTGSDGGSHQHTYIRANHNCAHECTYKRANHKCTHQHTYIRANHKCTHECTYKRAKHKCTHECTYKRANHKCTHQHTYIRANHKCTHECTY